MQVPSQSLDPEAASSCHPAKASEFRHGAVSPTVPGRAPPDSRLCKDARDSNSGRSSPSQRSSLMSPQCSASAPILLSGVAAEQSTQADGSVRKAVGHGRTAQPEPSRRSLVPPSSGPPTGSKWGPGISPRRCPGLGTPMRKARSAGYLEDAGEKIEDSGGRMSTSSQLSSPAAVRPWAMSADVPLRSPSACGGTGTALGLHQCGVGGAHCRRRPSNVTLGPPSRCGRASAGSVAAQPPPCSADFVDPWKGKQRESETDEVLTPAAMTACAREKRSPLALLSASPQRRTSQMVGRFRT